MIRIKAVKSGKENRKVSFNPSRLLICGKSHTTITLRLKGMCVRIELYCALASITDNCVALTV